VTSNGAPESASTSTSEVAFDRARSKLVHDPYIARAILTESGPDVVGCLSTHGRSGLGEAVLGNVAEEVVSASKHPVLLIGARVKRRAWESARRFTNGTLLCPVD
jgi:hypothetical protein